MSEHEEYLFDDVARLAIDAIRHAALMDLVDHHRHGWQPEYRMDKKVVDLLRRATALGLEIPPLEGCEWPDLQTTSAGRS